MRRLAPRWRAIVGAFTAAIALCACEQQQQQQANVGGPFTLTDHTGARVTEADFAGRPMLVYFGFTYCPDICPLSLQKLAIALEILGDDAALFQPVLISLDPERDTPEQMALYVESNGFPPDLVGLTGTPEEIAAVAQAYRVFYEKDEQSGSLAGYLINHTSILYLMDEQGRFASVFAPDDDPRAMAEELRQFASERGLAG